MEEPREERHDRLAGRDGIRVGLPCLKNMLESTVVLRHELGDPRADCREGVFATFGIRREEEVCGGCSEVLLEVKDDACAEDCLAEAGRAADPEQLRARRKLRIGPLLESVSIKDPVARAVEPPLE